MLRYQPSCFLVRAVAVLSLLGAAGCGDMSLPDEGTRAAAMSTSAPAASPSASSLGEPAPSPSLNESEVGFLTNIRHAQDLTDRSDGDLLASGRMVCSSLTADATYDAAVAPVLASGVSPESALILAATAVFEFCPEHDAVIEVALGGPESPAPDPEGSGRDQFLAAVRADPFFDKSVSDELAIMLGTTVCDGFTRGDSLDETLEYMASMPEPSAMTLLGAAVAHVCPEHAAKL